jgi:hypothetical protein
LAGIHGLSIDTIELYERNMIDELALRLVHGELPVVDKRELDPAVVVDGQPDLAAEVDGVHQLAVDIEL